MGDMLGEGPPTCSFCLRELTKRTTINCSECPAVLCVKCFQFGAEGGKHKRGHNYEIESEKTEALFSVRWSKKEEQDLIQTVHRFKLGNWNAVTQNLEGAKKKKGRDPDEVARHFHRFFIISDLGKIAMKEKEWTERRESFKDSVDAIQADPSGRWLYFHAVMEALRCSKQLPDPADEDAVEQIEKAVRDYYEAQSGQRKRKVSFAMAVPEAKKGSADRFGESDHEEWWEAALKEPIEKKERDRYYEDQSVCTNEDCMALEVEKTHMDMEQLEKLMKEHGISRSDADELETSLSGLRLRSEEPAASDDLKRQIKSEEDEEVAAPAPAAAPTESSRPPQIPEEGVPPKRLKMLEVDVAARAIKDSLRYGKGVYEAELEDEEDAESLPEMFSATLRMDTALYDCSSDSWTEGEEEEEEGATRADEDMEKADEASEGEEDEEAAGDDGDEGEEDEEEEEGEEEEEEDDATSTEASHVSFDYREYEERMREAGYGTDDLYSDWDEEKKAETAQHLQQLDNSASSDDDEEDEEEEEEEDEEEEEEGVEPTSEDEEERPESGGSATSGSGWGEDSEEDSRVRWTERRLLDALFSGGQQQQRQRLHVEMYRRGPDRTYRRVNKDGHLGCAQFEAGAPPPRRVKREAGERVARDGVSQCVQQLLRAERLEESFDLDRTPEARFGDGYEPPALRFQREPAESSLAASSREVAKAAAEDIPMQEEQAVEGDQLDGDSEYGTPQPSSKDAKQTVMKMFESGALVSRFSSSEEEDDEVEGETGTRELEEMEGDESAKDDLVNKRGGMEREVKEEVDDEEREEDPVVQEGEEPPTEEGEEADEEAADSSPEDQESLYQLAGEEPERDEEIEEEEEKAEASPDPFAYERDPTIQRRVISPMFLRPESPTESEKAHAAAAKLCNCPECWVMPKRNPSGVSLFGSIESRRWCSPIRWGRRKPKEIAVNVVETAEGHFRWIPPWAPAPVEGEYTEMAAEEPEKDTLPRAAEVKEEEEEQQAPEELQEDAPMEEPAAEEPVAVAIRNEETPSTPVRDERPVEERPEEDGDRTPPMLQGETSKQERIEPPKVDDTPKTPIMIIKKVHARGRTNLRVETRPRTPLVPPPPVEPAEEDEPSPPKQKKLTREYRKLIEDIHMREWEESQAQALRERADKHRGTGREKSSRTGTAVRLSDSEHEGEATGSGAQPASALEVMGDALLMPPPPPRSARKAKKEKPEKKRRASPKKKGKKTKDESGEGVVVVKKRGRKRAAEPEPEPEPEVVEEEKGSSDEEEDEDGDARSPSKKRSRRKKTKRIALTKKERKAKWEKKIQGKKQRQQAEKAKVDETPIDFFGEHELTYMRNVFRRQPFDAEDRGLRAQVNFKHCLDEIYNMGYSRERDDHEVEFYNEAEHIISRLNITNSERGMAVDMENEIKIAKVERFFRIMQERRALRNHAAEYETIPEFLQLCKKMPSERRRLRDIVSSKPEELRFEDRLSTVLPRDDLSEMKATKQRLLRIRARAEKLRELHTAGEETLDGNEGLSTLRPRTKNGFNDEQKKVDEIARTRILSIDNDIATKLAYLTLNGALKEEPSQEGQEEGEPTAVIEP